MTDPIKNTIREGSTALKTALTAFSCLNYQKQKLSEYVLALHVFFLPVSKVKDNTN